ncbi:TPA: hypothetical protein ACHWKL_002957 [Providencia stuartii]|uniref:hypothetical protein n=1 Tax=Providencia stuartii TaxID=588 RepID=UPI0013D952B3|nr:MULTISPECIES: hypothetical protein [Providencia]MBN5562957.1 hypothetical protein [Providencia stuartii]MBN5602957.1 hypothetical protein [Providencia stuartii]MBN5606981.1 hypothetical protein [Providencia stuartii]MDF4176145.1 hypothetical protein [Providencia thailandensis]MDN0012392.1 hypothetical protein [Providencia stuartii]
MASWLLGFFVFKSRSFSPLTADILCHQLTHGVFDGTELRLLLLVLLLHRSGVFAVGD